MAKRKSLGRGLDALLGSQVSAIERAESELRNIPIEQIRQSQYQPRVAIDSSGLEELANSIRAQGIVQPIVVRQLGDNYFEIIAGERRWRAAQLAGLNKVPAVVRNVPDKTVIAIALIENIQREALNPIEEANALRRLIDEFDMTHQAAAEAVGKSRAVITNLLRLLELNNDVKGFLSQGVFDVGHARALLGLSGALQSQAAQQVIAKQLSARETEHLVRRLKGKEKKKNSSVTQLDPDVHRLELDLSERLGAEVQVRHSAMGSGKLVIYYTSLDQLDGIIARIR